MKVKSTRPPVLLTFSCLRMLSWQKCYFSIRGIGTLGAPWPLTEFSEVSFGDTLGQVKPRLEPVGFFGKTQRLADVVVQTFGRAGTKVGRDGVR